MDIKFFIRTTGERVLHPSIERELGSNYTLLIDKDHRPVESFIEQLGIISEFDSVLLEDDVILCKDFVKEITKAITRYPRVIINFFDSPVEYYTTHYTTHAFCYNQCTFYPKGISAKLVEPMIRLRQPYNQYDTLVNKAIQDLKLVYVRYRPTLVQHIDYNTLIQKQNWPRRTIYFKDYLDELGISIEEAWIKENNNKLTNLLFEQFNEKH